MYNLVEVGLYDFSDESIDLFRNYVLDSPMLRFVQGRRRALGNGYA